MRVDRDQLVFKALCALEEAREQSRQGRVPPTFALRFALAYLYSVGDRRREFFDREPYDDFWQAATMEDEAGGSAAAFGRSQVMTSAFNGIARAAGVEPDVQLLERIGRARRRVHG